MSREERLRLDDILDACDAILAFAGGLTREAFFADRKTKDAVLWNLLVLGEAAKQAPFDLRQRHPEVEWRKLAGLRDIVAHEYFALDNDLLWDIVSNKVEPLRLQVQTILDGYP